MRNAVKQKNRMKMPLWKVLGIALLVSAGLTACSGEPSPSPIHNVGDPVVEPVPSPFTLNPKMVPDSTIAEFQKLELDLSIKSVDSIYEERILPIQKAGFNLAALTEPMNQGTQLIEIIRLYNGALQDLCEVEPKGQRCVTLLLDYESLVMHGCEANMKGCALIQTFRDTSSSIDVWDLVAGLETDDLDLKKQRIYVGLGIAKGQRHTRFERKLLALAPEIEAQFDRQRATLRGDMLRSQEEEEGFHYRQMERVIKFADTLGGSEEYKAYVRHIVGRPATKVVTKRSRLQGVVLKELGERGVIEEPWFQAALEEKFGKNPNSYTAAYEFVATKTDRALEIHNLEEKLVKDPAYYIVNNLFMRVWEVDSVRAMWNGSKQDKERLKKVIKDYTQVQFLKTVVRSHERMGSFYTASAKKGRQYMQHDMHRRAFEIANDIQSYWKRYFDRISRVRDFAMFALDSNIEEIKELKIDVENINQTVKLYVSTPHMLMLAYRMVKDKFEVRSWFGSVSGKEFFNHIFMNGIASWFDYRPEGLYYKWLNQTSLTLGMHFALRSEAFKFFGVEPNEFFGFITEELMNADIEAARDRLTLFTIPARVYKTQYEELLDVCEEERRFSEWELTPEETFSKPRHRNYSVTTTPDDFRFATLLFSSFGQIFYNFSTYNQDVPSDSPLRAYFRYNSNTHRQAIEEIRLSLQSKIKMVANIGKIYERYLVDDLKLTEGGEQIAALTKPIQHQLKRAEHFRRRFFSKVMTEVRNLFKDCATLLIRRELDMQNALYQASFEFYKQMYRDYQEIKSLRGRIEGGGPGDLLEARRQLEALVSKYQVSHPDLPKYAGSDYFDFDSEEFVTHSLDTIIRLGDFLRVGYQSDTFQTGPINNGVRLIMPVAGMKELQKFVDHSLRLKFTGVENEEEFATKAMRYMRGHDTKFDKYLVFWNRGHTWWAQFFLQDQINMYMNLYKVGKFEIYDDSATECQFENYRPSCESKVVQTEMDMELIVRDTFRTFELMTVSESDRRSLDLLGMIDRGQESNYSMASASGDREIVVYGSVAGYLFHPKNRDPMGFFDYHHLVLSLENLGWNIGFQMPWTTSFEGYRPPKYMPLMRARAFVYEFQDEKLLMMPIAPKVREVLLDDIKSAVDLEFNRVFEFHEAVLALAEDNQAAGIEYSYPVQTTEGDSVDGPYISQIRLNQAHDRLSGFHRDTLYMFDRSRIEGDGDE